MTLEALQHLLRSALALAPDRQFLVLGSASLLAAIPDLAIAGTPLASTYDADICPQPFDELTGEMLDEALGESRAYYRRHGYHADILRDSILETLPSGWQQRLVPVPGVDNAKAIEPHDLAAVKLLVGRGKYLALVRSLLASAHLDGTTVEDRIRQLPVPVETLPRVLANLRSSRGS